MNRSSLTHRGNPGAGTVRRLAHVAMAVILTLGSTPVLFAEQAGSPSVPDSGPVAPLSGGATLGPARVVPFANDVDYLSARLRRAPTVGLFDPPAIRSETILDNSRQPQASRASSRQESWAGKHPVLLGTLIGAGTGLVVESQGCGSTCYGLIAAPIAGAGAYGGLVASAIQKARAKEPISKSMKAGIFGGAIGAVLGSFLFCYGMGGCGGYS